MSYIPQPQEDHSCTDKTRQKLLLKESHFQWAFGDLRRKPADITDLTADLGLIFHFPAGESRLQNGGVCIWEDHMGRGSRASSGSFLVNIWKDCLTKLWWRLCCRHSKDPKPVGTGYEFASCWGYTGTCASVLTHKCWWPASLDPEGGRGAFLFGRRGNLTQIVPTPSQEICCHKSKGRKWLPVLDFWEKMKS